LTKKRILVLGGGFAGVDCTRKLESYFHSDYDIEITLVSDDNFLLFTPMLPQIVAGTVAPRHIVMPLRALCKKARIYESVVRDIDPVQQHVTLEGTPEKIGVRIHYDYLVIALGSETNYKHTCLKVSVPRRNDTFQNTAFRHRLQTSYLLTDTFLNFLKRQTMKLMQRILQI